MIAKNRELNPIVRLATWSIQIGVAAFVVAMIFLVGGCSTLPTITLDPQTVKQIQNAQTVAYTACFARQSSPIITEILHQAASAVIPGAEIGHAVIALACEEILTHPPAEVSP